METIARLRIKNKIFEIIVDSETAMKFRQGKSAQTGLGSDRIFSDIKKGLQASQKDLQEIFKTTDINAVAEKIIKQGEIEVPKGERDKQREERKTQIIDWISRNASSTAPISADRISSAIEQAGVNITKEPVEKQVPVIIRALQSIMPIRLEIKKLQLQIPAQHTAQAYGIVKEYKKKEEWMDNGDLLCEIELPAGLQDEFYEKLNKITHGAAITKELEK